jgi:hypothetical protein
MLFVHAACSCCMSILHVDSDAKAACPSSVPCLHVHFHVHPACLSCRFILRIHSHCQCLMSILHVSAPCPCFHDAYPCCMSLLYACPSRMSMMLYAGASCPRLHVACQFCRNMLREHEHGHADKLFQQKSSLKIYSLSGPIEKNFVICYLFVILRHYLIFSLVEIFSSGISQNLGEISN